MAFLKPQSPLAKGSDYFYPLTTADQVIMSNGLRMEDMVGKTITKEFVLLKDRWSGNAVPYTYSITVDGLADKIHAIVTPKYPITEDIQVKLAYRQELAKISYCERNNNIMVFECWEDIPNVNIIIQVEMDVVYPLVINE